MPKGMTECKKCNIRFPSSLSKKHRCPKHDIF